MDEKYVRAFWTHVQQGDGCWLWTASVGGHGYGQTWDGTVRTAHRVSWELHNGPIPKGLHILHRCNNRRCVNPAHLYAGTNLDNARDRMAAGQAVGGGAKGASQWNAKLTEENVREIRRRRDSGEILRTIAADFGIQEGSVWTIAARKSWRHVPG